MEVVHPANPPFPGLVRPDGIREASFRFRVEVELLEKVRIDPQAGAPHDWILNPARARLCACIAGPTPAIMGSWTGRDAPVHAEPFDAIALQVADLFDDEDG